MNPSAPPAKRAPIVGVVVLIAAISIASQWWVGRHQRELGAQVATLAQPGDIRMLASETCAVCGAARAWMKEHRVAFTECQIEHDAACRAEFDARGAAGTPVMVVRGRALLGFNPAQLHEALKAKA